MPKHIFSLVFFILVAQNLNAQQGAYRYWNFHFGDSIVSAENNGVNIINLVSDSANSSYILHYSPNEKYAKCTKLNRFGETEWTTTFDYLDTNHSTYLQKAKIVEFQNNIYAILPVSSSTDYHHDFLLLNKETGTQTKLYENKIPINEDSRYSFLQTDSLLFFKESDINTDGIIKLVQVNLLDGKIKQNTYQPINGYVVNNIGNFCNINDSLIGLVVPIGIAGQQGFGIQVYIIRKKNLTVKSTHYEPRNVYPSSLLGQGDAIYLFNTDHYSFDINAQRKYYKHNFKTGLAQFYGINNFLMHNRKDTVSVLRTNILGETIFNYTDNNTDSNLFEQVWNLNNGNEIYLSSTINYNTGIDVAGTPYYRPYATNIRVISPTGHLINRFYKKFDSTTSRIYELTTFLDNKKNLILISNLVHSLDNRSIVTPHIQKICTNCDTSRKTSLATIPTFENYITAYPSPTAEVLNIKYGVVTNGKIRLTITNLFGQTVYTETMSKKVKGEYFKTLNLKNLGISKGQYILGLHTVYKTYSTQFIYQGH